MILKDFMEVCEENHFTYFGLAGTGIGAIRHGGFIPWDDDIDIGILRPDLDKLVEIFKERFPDKYTIGNCDNLKNYPLMTTRIMLKGTKFVEDAVKDINCELGIFLDVYPFDEAANTENAYKTQALKTWFYSKLLILRYVSKPVRPFKGIKAKLAHAVCAMVHGSMVIFRVSPKFLYKKCLKASSQYNGQGKKRIAVFFDTNPYTQTTLKEYVDRPVYHKFEDVMLPFPSNIDEMLRDMFGDYMQLPPEDKRKNHFPHELDFGDVFEKYNIPEA